MAKTTGKISGNLILISIGGTTVTCSTNASFNGTTERIETSCKDDDGAKTYEPGSQDGTFQCQGITKFDTASNFTLIFAAWKNKTKATFKMGGLANADDPYVQFQGFITNVTF